MGPKTLPFTDTPSDWVYRTALLEDRLSALVKIGEVVHERLLTREAVLPSELELLRLWLDHAQALVPTRNFHT